jgi:hypothetical protein
MNLVSLRDCPHPHLPAFNPHTAALKSHHWRLLLLLPRDPVRLGKDRNRATFRLSPHNHRHPTKRPRQLLTGDPRPNELPRIMPFVGHRQLKSSTSLIGEACLEVELVRCLLPESLVLLAALHPTSIPNHSPLAAIKTTPTPKADDRRQQHTLQRTRSTLDSFSLVRRSIAPLMGQRQISMRSVDLQSLEAVPEIVVKNCRTMIVPPPAASTLDKVLWQI